MSGGLARIRAVLPAPLRARLGELRDRQRSIRGHIELYGPAKRIDPTYADLIRSAPLETLTDPAALAEWLPQLGLNDELLEQFPQHLRPQTGFGLLHWQYPLQFSRYLVEISQRRVGSYVEIGTRHGGTFVLTVEYLRRFHPLEWALGIDIQAAPGLEEYAADRPETDVRVMDSRGRRFRREIERHAPIDLVLIDGDHSEEGVRAGFEMVRDHARMVAFHDIVNGLVPGVGSVWREVVDNHADEWECLEFTDQYPEVVAELGCPLLGIGLAIRRQSFQR